MPRSSTNSMKKKNIGYWALALAVIVSIIGLAVWQSRPIEGVERVANLGNEHIDSIESPHGGYNSSPPTSGPHIGSIAPWGLHDEPIPDEMQVHNLEDGGVLIQYREDELSDEQVEELEEIGVTTGRKHVIVAPYPDMEHTIALTAWNRILPLDSIDRDRILDFVRKYEGLDHHAR